MIESQTENELAASGGGIYWGRVGRIGRAPWPRQLRQKISALTSLGDALGNFFQPVQAAEYLSPRGSILPIIRRVRRTLAVR